MSVPTTPDLAELTARFGHAVHAAGLPVTPERSARLAAAMALAPPATREELYWLARLTMVAEHEQIETFDRVFALVFGGVLDPAEFRGDRPPAPTGSPGPSFPSQPGGPARSGQYHRPSPSILSDGEPGDPRPSAHRETVVATASPDERLRRKDFSALTEEELARLRVLSDQMALAPPPRRSRRRVRSRQGSDLDVRATLRRAARRGGEPLVPVRRRRRNRPRRLVLLCDISGSMEGYARVYLQLLVGGVGGARAEAFVFATRLTRLTRPLRGALPDAALRRAGRLAPDWSGGTRIGEAIKAFNDGYGRRGLARGAVVVVLSDGWDCGDPQALGREMARLQRLAYRIVWVNPRKAAPEYAPLAGGMAAALPYVDTFVSGHSLAAFDGVLRAVSAL